MNRTLKMNNIKRALAIVLMLFTFAFIVEPIASAHASPAAAAAQTTTRRRVRRHRSFWRKHRDKLTVAGTTLAGAGIGGLAGGKKGALIGAGAGAGSGALYTYKLRKRRHRRY